MSDAALEETGNQTVRNVVRVGEAGQQRQVNLTSYLSVYNRTVDASDLNASRFGTLTGNANAARTPDGGDGVNATVPVVNASSAGSFSVFAVPNARVAGRSVHPLSRLSTEQLVRRFVGLGTSSVRFEGNRTVESMDAERTVSTFRLDRGANGTDGLVHVATVETGTDFFVVAVHPALIDERSRVDRLVAGLEQPFA